VAAGPLVAAGLLALPGALSAQQSGVQLTFGISQRVEMTENLALDVVSAGSTLQAVTGLSFGLASDTPNSLLRFNTSSDLNAIRNPDGTSDTELLTPRLSFNYGQSAANASFDVSASYDESDIAFLRPLTDFTDSNGVIVLPTDLDDLTGTGLRRSTDVRGRLSFGDAGPIGLTLRAGYSDINYVNASNSSLTDNSRFDLGAALRVDINAVTSAQLGTTWSRFEDTTASDRITRGINAGIDVTRPNGSVGATVSFTDGPDGSRTAFAVTRSLDLPRGTLSGSLGASRDSEGQLRPNGALRYSQQLPNGQFRVGITQFATVDSSDAEQITTAVTLGVTHQLTAISGVSADFNYVDNQSSASGVSTITASFGLNYNQQITKDWGLTAGYRHDLRDDGLGSRANSDSVFVQVGRSFQFRP
jgi:hypothetical protein